MRNENVKLLQVMRYLKNISIMLATPNAFSPKKRVETMSVVVNSISEAADVLREVVRASYDDAATEEAEEQFQAIEQMLWGQD